MKRNDTLAYIILAIACFAFIAIGIQKLCSSRPKQPPPLASEKVESISPKFKEAWFSRNGTDWQPAAIFEVNGRYFLEVPTNYWLWYTEGEYQTKIGPIIK